MKLWRSKLQAFCCPSEPPWTRRGIKKHHEQLPQWTELAWALLPWQPQQHPVGRGKSTHGWRTMAWPGLAESCWEQDLLQFCVVREPRNALTTAARGKHKPPSGETAVVYINLPFYLSILEIRLHLHSDPASPASLRTTNMSITWASSQSCTTQPDWRGKYRQISQKHIACLGQSHHRAPQKFIQHKVKREQPENH